MKHYIYLLSISLIFSSCMKKDRQNSNIPYQQQAHFRSHTVNTFNHNKIYRLPVWQFQTEGPIHSTPLLAGDNVYVGSDDGSLYALDEKNGQQKWSFDTGRALFSSPAIAENVIFIANEDYLYAVDAIEGVEQWKFQFQEHRAYPWKFDRFLSSPVPSEGMIYIGSSDGYLYAIDRQDGQEVWKFKSEDFVRSTPVIHNNTVYFGDTRGKFYALDAKSGAQRWSIELEGYATSKEESGNDLQAVISSPIVHEGMVIFGCRDSYLYALDANTGETKWKVYHGGTWVIGSPVAEGQYVYVGTADQRYIEAVNSTSGEVAWRSSVRGMVWSSPIIIGDYIYAGTSDGFLCALSKQDGKQMTMFTASAGIFSSPVADEKMLYFGADDGVLYALQPVKIQNDVSKVVYWQQDKNFKYFNNQTDLYIRDYFKSQGYEEMDDEKLELFVKAQVDSVPNSLIVLASNNIPANLMTGGSSSLLHQYLKNGGKVAALGPNPIIYKKDETGRPYAFDFVGQPDSILEISYFENDYRSYSGFQGAYPTELGKALGLSNFFMATCPVDPSKVTEVYASDRDGLAVAWLKSYSHPGKGFAQLWLNRSYAEHPATIQQVAEYGVLWTFD